MDPSYHEATYYGSKLDASRTSPDEEYAGSLREERVRTLLTEIDPAVQVESIVMKLRGYFFDKRRNSWVKRKNAAQISDNFIAKVEYILSEELSLNTTFSNLQPADINKIMNLLIDILVSDVTVHGRNYTVKIEFEGKEKVFNLADDLNLKEIVLFGIFSSVYKSLRRCINGSEAKRFFGSLRMNETISPPQNKKQSILDAIKSME